ncbi:MAG: hypothetical protein V2J65_01765 [Desulfobacteraceae bacterium]|nr:hypothetical protein [Desulfobacteraceae bacterium]
MSYSEELKILISGQYLTTTAFAIGTLFALIGAAITCRHRKIMSTKINWIFDAEIKLGLIKTEQNKYGIINPEDVKIPIPNIWPRFGSVSFFILVFYALFIIVDIFIIAGFLEG